MRKWHPLKLDSDFRQRLPQAPGRFDWYPKTWTPNVAVFERNVCFQIMIQMLQMWIVLAGYPMSTHRIKVSGEFGGLVSYRAFTPTSARFTRDPDAPGFYECNTAPRKHSIHLFSSFSIDLITSCQNLIYLRIYTGVLHHILHTVLCSRKWYNNQYIIIIYTSLLLSDLLDLFFFTNLPSLRTPTEDLASDAAIAWLLSLDPSPESPSADSRSRRDFRAEARSRVQERRQREEEMCLREKLIEIWGVHRMSAVYTEQCRILICNDM